MPAKSTPISELIRRADGVEALLQEASRVMAGLPVTDEVVVEQASREPRASRGDVAWLEREGHGRLHDIETPERCSTMVRAIDGLLAAGLPAVFVYLGDPLWALGERVRARISELLGRPYHLIADVWAWRIERGERGWPPHRGWSTRVLDARAPELVNVWVALSDVAADQSCIHVVPLEQDAHYPASLERVDAPLQSIVSLPLDAGGALFWNANTLHWGGQCSRRATGARYSCSFSLVREDALELIGWPALRVGELDPRSRVDLVAAQIATYGDGQPDVPPEIRAWAHATTALGGPAIRLLRRD
jgi:hypothetical protein